MSKQLTATVKTILKKNLGLARVSFLVQSWPSFCCFDQHLIDQRKIWVPSVSYSQTTYGDRENYFSKSWILSYGLFDLLALSVRNGLSLQEILDTSSRKLFGPMTADPSWQVSFSYWHIGYRITLSAAFCILASILRYVCHRVDPIMSWFTNHFHSLTLKSWHDGRANLYMRIIVISSLTFVAHATILSRLMSPL